MKTFFFFFILRGKIFSFGNRKITLKYIFGNVKILKFLAYSKIQQKLKSHKKLEPSQ